MKLILVTKGGAGSGDFGHAGRHGKRGGSAKGRGGSNWTDEYTMRHRGTSPESVPNSGPLEIPTQDSFSKGGNVPDGWHRVGHNSVRTARSMKNGDTMKIRIGYWSKQVAEFFAERVHLGKVLGLPIYNGELVRWDSLANRIKKLLEE